MAHWPEREPAMLTGRVVEIDRRRELSPEETMSRYLLAGEGTPVVVTDAQAQWPAAKLWSLDYFKEHYAGDTIMASDRAPLRYEDNPKMQTLKVTATLIRGRYGLAPAVCSEPYAHESPSG